LETLREYALERLVASGEAEATRAAHATYYIDLARRLSAEHFAQINFRGSFGEEIDNFRAALRWSADRARWDDCLDVIGSLSTYWMLAGYLNESVQWIDVALQHREEISPAARSRVLRGLGILAFGRGDLATAESALRDSIAMGRDCGDNLGVAMSLFMCGSVLRDQARFAEAQSAVEESVRLAQAVGDPRVIAMGLSQLGMIARQQGDLPRAEALLTEGLQLGRRSTGARALAAGTFTNWVWLRKTWAISNGRRTSMPRVSLCFARRAIGGISRTFWKALSPLPRVRRGRNGR
jgi:tetratricopeptide (TPR) repeat protein